MLNAIRFNVILSYHYKMNENVNKFLLAGDRFMPEMHLEQIGFTYSACELFTKNNKRIQKFKETGNTRYIYKNELDKTCFQHDLAYKDFKYFVKTTMYFQEIKNLILLKTQNMMDIEEVLLLWFITF